MHSYVGSTGITFSHYGDYLGDVTISDGKGEMVLPMAAMEEFVLEALRTKTVQKIENLSTEEFKKWLTS